MQYSLLLSVLTQWMVHVAGRDVIFFNVPSVFGDQNDPATRRYYGDACRNCSLFGTGMYYNHENACNMVIQCIPLGSNWIVFGFVAPQGAVFDDSSLVIASMFVGDGTTPNRQSCRRVGHPCDTGKMIPVDNDACKGFQLCINNRMVQRKCPNPYTGFNARTQACDLPCNRRLRTLISERCEANPSSDDYFYSYQTVKYSDEASSKVEFFNLRCNLGFKYLQIGQCQCQPYNETLKPCETRTVVHLDSADDSWRLARNNSAPQNASALTGNVTFVSNVNTNFKYAPLFRGNYALSAPMIRGNDLGLYFDMTMTFESLQDDQISPGLTFPFTGTREIALADNSACDITATYGCKLMADSDNRGRVVCYVKPNMESDHPDNKVVTSRSLDLRSEIRVYFAKDDTAGILRVSADGNDVTTRFSFPEGVRARGNACPLSIGAGSRIRYFKGYMKKLIVKKYCGTFL